MQPAAPLFASALSAPLASPDEDSWSYLAASLPPRPRPQSFGHFVPRSRSLSRRSSRNSEMEVNEESGADLKLKEEEEEEPGFNGPGFPPPSEAQPDPSTTALAALANTFPPSLWNPPGMKFLQDLVPGCSKVIGKAVMLDEIINYVQSLQRQVEFLSMKLSAVNPALEFNIERILSKDFFQSQGPASSAFGFLPDINFCIHQNILKLRSTAW